jgi:tRNA threonylcarbamoyladenosine biosynthesis protein TsaE
VKVMSGSEADTRRIAATFVRELPEGVVVRLWGDLGAGKTAFVRGMLEGLGWEGPVTSPTYTLVQEYDTDPPLVHADLYRLQDPEDVWDLELDAFIESRDLLAVEWSERVPSFWPADAWHVRIAPLEGAPGRREITMVREMDA